MRFKYVMGAGAAVFVISWAAFSASSSPVADAVMQRDKAALRSLIQQKANVNAPQADGATAILWAAYNNDLESADVLIAAGANVKAANQEGATALYLASMAGNAVMISHLLQAGADPNERGPQGETPLMLASRNGNLEAIKVLLDHKADVNAKEKLRGTTPLMWASAESHPAAVKLLIEHGASVSVVADPDAGGKPRNNLANPVSQRLNSAFGVNGQGRGRGGNAGQAAAGGAAAQAGSQGPAAPGAPGQARALSPGGAAVEGPQSVGTPPVAQPAAGAARGGGRGRGRGNPAAAPAATGGDAAAALAAAGVDTAALAAAGVDLSLLANIDPTVIASQAQAAGFGRGAAVKDGGGLTALVLAARQDCLECAKALLDAGADVNQVTNYGWTALLTATQNRHYKLATYLLDRGANPNIANKGGWTPLYLATDNRNIEGGDYPVRTPDMDHLDFIKLLIDKGANVNARICGAQSTPDKCTGDTTETRTNFTMQWLFEDGATPFLRAAQSGDVTLMKLLLAHGADPKIFTAHNVTPLAVAAGIGWVEGVTFEWSPEQSLEAVKMCLDLGIDPNVADDEGRTSLHGAAHKGRTEVIQLLVDHGANMLAEDMGSRDSINGGMLGQKWIPLDWARGLVRVGVQSAIPHPEAEKLLVKLMTEKGLKVPPPPDNSRCLTVGIKGCQ